MDATIYPLRHISDKVARSPIGTTPCDYNGCHPTASDIWRIFVGEHKNETFEENHVSHLARLLLVSALAAAPAAAFATNLLNLTGYGAESSALGGADAPLSRDPFALNLNPAGLAQIKGKAFDFYVTTYDGHYNTHSDSFGAYRKPVADTYYGIYGGIGYAQRLPDTNITAGVALIVQGGGGWSYKNLNTAFGTRDELSGVFGATKVAAGAAWEATDRLNVGASIGLNYASGEQSFFPHTSVLNTFYGLRLKDVSGYAFNAKLGAQYRFDNDVVLGVDWGSRTNIAMKGGSLRVNYTADPAIGQVVRYDDAQLRGIVFAQELAVGVAFRPVPRLMVAVQDKWYDWSDALRTTRIVAKASRNAAAPATVSLASGVNAVDQHVFSIGFAWDYDDKTVLRAGGNYAHRAIPDQNMSASFAAIQAGHLSLGIERVWDADWRWSATWEMDTRQMVTYTNPKAPFGPNATETHGGNLLHVAISRRW